MHDLSRKISKVHRFLTNRSSASCALWESQQAPHFCHFILKTKKDLQDLIAVDLLVLDDFGNEYKNVFIRDTIIYPLLNERLKNGKLTWFTSAYTVKDIINMYSFKSNYSPKAAQLGELIKSLAKEFTLTGIRFYKKA